MIERKCTVILLRKVGFYNFCFPKRKCYIKQKWACVFSVVFILSGRKIKKKNLKINLFLNLSKILFWGYKSQLFELFLFQSHNLRLKKVIFLMLPVLFSFQLEVKYLGKRKDVQKCAWLRKMHTVVIIPSFF